MAEEFVKLVNSDTWKPKAKGDSLEGVFDRTEKSKYQNKVSLAHIIKVETSKGTEEKKVFGATLDKVLCLVDQGTFVKIIYTGIKNLGGYKNLRLFDVLIRKDDIKRLELDEDNYIEYDSSQSNKTLKDADDPEAEETIRWIRENEVGNNATDEQIIAYAENWEDLTEEDVSRIKICLAQHKKVEGK
jgi:hypothetical protein